MSIGKEHMYLQLASYMEYSIDLLPMVESMALLPYRISSKDISWMLMVKNRILMVRIRDHTEADSTA